MPKIAPNPPSYLEIAPNLEQVLLGHEDRLARFRVDRQDPVVSKEEADLMLTTLINLLSEIVMEGRGRKWAMVGERCFGVGACIELQEAKTGARARFGLYGAGFALSLDLDRAPMIGRVRDAFWAHVLTLGGFGQLTYDPMAIPQALCSRRSTTVPVRPGYAINELMKYWHLLKLEGDSLIDFGCLAVSWPLETPVNVLLPAMAGTLDTFYRISYELYRLDRSSRTGE